MRTLALLSLVACTGTQDDGPWWPDDSGAVDDSGAADDTGSGPDTAEPPPGTDADSDGFTVEMGDCDDGDIWVNPAWPEQAGDGKDNDCDGRIDERFAGVAAIELDLDGLRTTRLVRIDPLGDLLGSTDTGAGVYPEWAVEAHDGDGWAMWDPSTGQLVQVSAAGAVSVLVDCSGYDWGLDLVDAPWGIARYLDGTYVLSGIDRLLQLDPTSTSCTPTLLASWAALPEVGDHELAAAALAWDPHRKKLGVFGYFGGFAVFDPEDGLRIVVPEPDPENPAVQYTYAQAHDNGDWFALGTDGSDGTQGIYRFNRTRQEVVLRGTMPDSDFPFATFAIESGTGDFYLTSNVGQARTVWRLVEDGTYAALLFPFPLASASLDATLRFGPVGILWESDPPAR